LLRLWTRGAVGNERLWCGPRVEDRHRHSHGCEGCREEVLDFKNSIILQSKLLERLGQMLKWHEPTGEDQDIEYDSPPVGRGQGTESDEARPEQGNEHELRIIFVNADGSEEQLNDADDSDDVASDHDFPFAKVFYYISIYSIRKCYTYKNSIFIS
jgi:hypothetical protein